MSLSRSTRSFLRAAALLLGLAPLLAFAGSFSVVPVRILFAPKDRAVAVTLTNLGDTPIALNAELYAWKQRADGSDQLTATDDIVLAPPLIRLAPKARQVVRLALLRAPDPQVQLSFRMIVREVPELSPRGGAVAIPVSLALNIPIFVTPAEARWDVDCAAQADDAGPQLRCRNTGNAAGVVRDARLEKDGAPVAAFSGGAYILPGVSRPIPMEPRLARSMLPGKLVLTFEDDQRVVIPLPSVD